jgi:RNA polymerase sigma-70 factor (ECF subfamily)
VSLLEFEAFYLGTARRLIRYAFGLTGDLAEAQDLSQEAYARAWQRWRKVGRYDNPEAWLRLVVNRLATDRWRKLSVRRGQPSTRIPDSTPPPDEDLVTVVAALKALPFEQRQALTLFYLLDRSVADIAAETGANENTIRSWLARGRASLAATLGGEQYVR